MPTYDRTSAIAAKKLQKGDKVQYWAAAEQKYYPAEVTDPDDQDRRIGIKFTGKTPIGASKEAEVSGTVLKMDKTAWLMDAASKSELKELQDILKEHGYDPKDAKALAKEGIGPTELEHCIKTTKPGQKGSLEYTHNLKKLSHFEEGVPADPTENMSEEDAQKWKDMNEEHRDNFKTAFVHAKPAKAIIDELFKEADKLYDARVPFRYVIDTLQDLYGDPTGLNDYHGYNNPAVKKVRDCMMDLDHSMGDTARQMEYLARQMRDTAKTAKAWPKGDYALVQAKGMDDIVLSVHKTQEDAEKAMRKHGGEPNSLFQKGMRVVNVGPKGKNEVIEIFGKLMVRPKTASEMPSKLWTRVEESDVPKEILAAAEQHQSKMTWKA